MMFGIGHKMLFSIILIPFLLSAEPTIGFGGGVGCSIWSDWKGPSGNLSLDLMTSDKIFGYGFSLFGSYTEVNSEARKISFYNLGGLCKCHISIFELGVGYCYIPEFKRAGTTSVSGVSSPLFLLGLKFNSGSFRIGAENIFATKLQNFYNPTLTLSYNIPLKKRERPPVEGPPIKREPEVVAKKPERLPPYLEIISLTLKDGNNDGILEALERGEINLTVQNKGKGNGYDLNVIVSALENYEGLRFEEAKIDFIGMNETKTIKIPIYADKKVKTQEVKLRIDVKEPYFGADADPRVLVFSTKRLEPPDVKIAQTSVDDDEEGESMGNSNSKIELGETVELTTILQNLGTGMAENTKVQVLPLRETEVMYLGKDSIIPVGNIKPGEWKKVVLPIYVSKRFEGDEFSLRLKITETRLNISRDTTLVFALNKPFQKPSEIIVSTRPPIEEKPEIQPLPELTADVDVDIPVTGMKNKNGIAVIIGCAEYSKPDVPKVEYGLRDARIVKEYLINMFGYQEANVIFLQNPTKADWERVFGIKGNPKGQLYNYVKKDESDVFVYYTGHGAPDLKEKRAYFVPSDADPSYIELQGYPLDLFFENLSQLPAKRITVVIDACFSGAYDKGLIIKYASPLTGVKVERVEGIKDKGIVMTATESDEVASWYPEKKHSLFTYFFLKGLRGEADKNGDKEITVEELESYVKEEASHWARRLYNREQNPRFEGEKGLVILRLR